LLDSGAGAGQRKPYRPTPVQAPNAFRTLYFGLREESKSEFVDEFVMDSNMALNGAPSSPSIVGILVSTAQAYGKIIHYEAARERILPCEEKGQPQLVLSGKGDKGGQLLLHTGM
jgi:hypothetical protein